MLSKPTEWLIEGRRGRTKVRLNFETRELELYNMDGSIDLRTDTYSFESIPDLVSALGEAEGTLISVGELA